MRVTLSIKIGRVDNSPELQAMGVTILVNPRFLQGDNVLVLGIGGVEDIVLDSLKFMYILLPDLKFLQ
jgi:hypothetical protein